MPSPKKNPDSSHSLGRNFGFFYQEKLEHFCVSDQIPFGNLLRALRAVLSNRYITGATLMGHIYNFKILSGPIKKIQKRLIHFNNYFTFI